MDQYNRAALWKSAMVLHVTNMYADAMVKKKPQKVLRVCEAKVRPSSTLIPLMGS